LWGLRYFLTQRRTLHDKLLNAFYRSAFHFHSSLALEPGLFEIISSCEGRTDLTSTRHPYRMCILTSCPKSAVHVRWHLKLEKSSGANPSETIKVKKSKKMTATAVSLDTAEFYFET
jgi:hypothetical protein